MLTQWTNKLTFPFSLSTCNTEQIHCPFLILNQCLVSLPVVHMSLGFLSAAQSCVEAFISLSLATTAKNVILTNGRVPLNKSYLLQPGVILSYCFVMRLCHGVEVKKLLRSVRARFVRTQHGVYKQIEMRRGWVMARDLDIFMPWLGKSCTPLTPSPLDVGSRGTKAATRRRNVNHGHKAVVVFLPLLVKPGNL